MNNCPESGDFIRLIDDSLDADKAEDLESHLSSCTNCEALFQQLVANEYDDWDTWRAFISTNERHTTTKSPSQRVEVLTPELNAHLEQNGFAQIQEIGRGGMGIVVRAWDTSLHRSVAIKLLSGGALSGPERIERLKTEARAIGQLKHPHIVQIHSVDHFQNIPYLVLEFIDGDDLSSRLDEEPLSQAESIRIATELTDALAHAHSHSVIHRDVKPSNVLMADGSVRLADFGLAKLTEDTEQLTFTDAVLGTRAYMSPEQARGDHQAVGPTTDVYAVGIVLYEMLCGIPPFRNARDMDWTSQTHDPVRPRQLRPEVSRDLETICLKCLEFEPARRYATAADLLSDLQNLRDGLPISARPAGPLRRLYKWARRRPARAGSIAVVLTTLVAILVTWGIFTRQIASLNQNLTESNARLKEEKAISEERRVVSEATREFLYGDLLIQASAQYQIEKLTASGQSTLQFQRDPTIGWLLDRAAAKVAGDGLEKRFPGQPKVQAEVLKMLGMTYCDIGKYDKSAQLLERALSIHADGGTSEFNEDVLDLWNSLSLRYIELGKYEDAIQQLERLRSYYAQKPPTGDSSAAKHNLAGAYMLSGKNKKALILCQEAAAEFEKLRGPTHRDTLSARSTLSQILVMEDRGEEAVEIMEAVVKDMTRALGTLHPNNISAMHKLSDALIEAGDIERGTEYAAKSHTLALRVLGEEHPKTAYYERSWGECLFKGEQKEEGIAHIRSALVVMEKVHAADHPMVLETRAMLARKLELNKQHADAAELLEKILADTRRRTGTNSRAALKNIGDLVRNLVRSEQAQRAADLIDESIAAADESGDVEPVVYASLQKAREVLRKYIQKTKSPSA